MVELSLAKIIFEVFNGEIQDWIVRGKLDIDNQYRHNVKHSLLQVTHGDID